MKNWVTYLQHEKRTVPYLALALLVFSMPVYKPIAAYFILLLFLCCIPFRHFRLNKTVLPLLFLAFIYMLHIIGLTYTEHPDAANRELEYKASYFVFPVIALVVPSISLTWRCVLMWCFTAACFSFVCWSVIESFLAYHLTGQISELGYEMLSKPFHPTYMAMYLSFSLGWILYSIAHKQYIFGKKYMSILALVILIFYINMLASKAGVLTATAVICWAAWVWYKNQVSWKQILVLIPALIIWLFASALLIPTTSVRIKAAVNDVKNIETPHTQMATSSSDIRTVVWKSAIELISKNPFGVGTGDTTPELVKIYLARGENFAAEKNLNAHNQFLQVTCEHGWPALAFLLFCLILLVRLSLKTNNALFQLFIGIMLFNFLFESILERQEGIVFFCCMAMVMIKTETE